MTSRLDFAADHADRVLLLEGAHNFRHVCGWRTADGRSVRPGLIYRASSLHHLTQSDAAVLAKLGIGHVFDLRSSDERESLPTPGAAIGPVGYWSGAESSANADLTRLMRRQGAALAEFQAAMDGVYADFPHSLGEALAHLFDVLVTAEDGTATLIHCAAGKDRTGFIVAMLLRALGVAEADVEADYLLTNATFERAFAAFSAGHGLDRVEAETPGATAALLGAHRAYLASADAEVLDKWGSHDAYLDLIGGLTPEKRWRLQARYLTPAP